MNNHSGGATHRREGKEGKERDNGQGLKV